MSLSPPGGSGAVGGLTQPARRRGTVWSGSQRGPLAWLGPQSPQGSLRVGEDWGLCGGRLPRPRGLPRRPKLPGLSNQVRTRGARGQGSAAFAATAPRAATFPATAPPAATCPAAARWADPVPPHYSGGGRRAGVPGSPSPCVL